MFIKPVSNNVFDVFVGNGWSNWARFEKKSFKGRVFISLIKGNALEDAEFSKLREVLANEIPEEGVEV